MDLILGKMIIMTTHVIVTTHTHKADELIALQDVF